MVTYFTGPAEVGRPHDDVDISVRVRRPVTICISAKLKELMTILRG
jgi:hypothetical protein